MNNLEHKPTLLKLAKQMQLEHQFLVDCDMRCKNEYNRGITIGIDRIVRLIERQEGKIFSNL